MKILIIVSGGDAPGINAALFHLADTAAQHGDTLIGARGGFSGVLAEQFMPLDARALAPLIGLGGSFLPSSRDPVLKEETNRQQLQAIFKRHGFDHLILFGGGGTLHYLPPILQTLGINCVGIPTTIDNDIAATTYSLGFHSACEFAYHAVDGIRATAGALEGRLFTLETLGGDSGMLALSIASGSSADGVLLPEYPNVDEDALAARLKAAIVRKGHALLVYNEYVQGKNELIERIAVKVGVRLRDTRLGHAQRGGTSVHMDRILAQDFARIAYGAAQQRVSYGMTVLEQSTHFAFLQQHFIEEDRVKAPNPYAYNLINGITP